MRRWLLVVSLFVLASTLRAEALRGSWRLTQSFKGLHLELAYDHSNWGRTVTPDQFLGLDPSLFDTRTETPAKFQIVREAGTMDFSGTFLEGDGVGRFSFTPDSSYAGKLQSLGVTPTEIADERLFQLASLDVSTSFIRDMQALGYRESSLDRYIRFRIHGVSPEFVRAMQAEGYRDLSADQLVTFRIHGVNPEFAKSMRELGVRDLSAGQLVAMRIHGVRSDYVRALAELAYRDLRSDQLVTMRIHGMSTNFIRELADAGYRNIPVDKLIEMRIHGVDAAFVRKLK